MHNQRQFASSAQGHKLVGKVRSFAYNGNILAVSGVPALALHISEQQWEVPA
jgi:hypothetical protein